MCSSDLGQPGQPLLERAHVGVSNDEPPIQQQLALFFEAVLNARIQSAQLQAAVTSPVLEAQAAVQGNAQRVAVENGPPPEEQSLTSSGPKKAGPKAA